MPKEIELLDVVALIKDLPDRQLIKGQMGTVVEIYEPGVFEVEFSDEEGETYAQLAIEREALLLLHHHPVKAA